VSARTLAALAVTLACDVAASQSAGIQRAAWLQGCWEMSTPGRSVEEIWTTPKGGSMIGVSRTIRDVATNRELMTILIAHRLSTVRHADRIFVLERGRIVESGGHEELLDLKGLYYAMWRQQVGERRAEGSATAAPGPVPVAVAR